ncbi:MAG TPA: AmmeMemoRadiSam system protein A [Bacillota bacterium]|nr:AmmeMemoRadiSam system protein A [Bacillota bacterium]HOL09013.1 AmmeMemoRadiSam system protein A [Bacillota bacterium]HPO96688.1 AmmeMemoRadiSam system protein A [Bacillota bacterium]
MICGGALLPHPPIMVDGIGKPDDLSKVRQTREAVGEIDRIFAELRPDTLVILTPHGTVYSDAIIIYEDSKLTGSLRRFGLSRSFCWENDLELAEAITKISNEAGLPVHLLDYDVVSQGRGGEVLDHGVLVPLSFFDPDWVTGVKLVVIPTRFLPFEELYRFGKIIDEAAEAVDRRVAVIASGDLSHCLQDGAPVRYNPKGAEFDRQVVNLLNNAAVEDFFNFDPVLLEQAAECGFRSIIMLLGAFDSCLIKSKVHSYEGPFGVGYAVASLLPQGPKAGLIEKLFNRRRQQIETRREHESPLVSYARGVVESYVKKLPVSEVAGLEQYKQERAGVFVSIKKYGQLRGCIGTIEPTQENVVLEVRQNAISAATRDPRFDPVTEDELTELIYSVDILKPPEKISGIAELDPKHYGVIVTQGKRRGLLLPNLEGIDTREEQVAIAKRKAGISQDDDVELERFEVIRYQ